MAESPIATADGVVGPGAREFVSVIRRRRLGYGVATLALAAGIAAVIGEAVDAFDAVGVSTTHATATGGGYELDVRYATVTRPALATPFDITVKRDGGFDENVVVAVDAEYLAMWDENGLDPAPTAETSTDSWIVWEFEPPDLGDTLTISFDARIEPAAQSGESGAVALLDDDGEPVVQVDFRTSVRP